MTAICRSVQHFAVRCLFTSAVVIALQSVGLAQQGGSREIVSGDFTKSRPTADATRVERNAQRQGASSSKARPGKKKPGPRRYRLASPASPKPLRPSGETIIEQLGITLWRLRPAKASDKRARTLVMEDATGSAWVPERIEADTPLREGDRVRLSIESPRAGYLYVVDRDLFDGTMGDAMLIFPTLRTRGGDNQVRAGKLIEIPAQEDTPNYFTANPSRSDQVGELLTVIVTTSPLDLPITNKPMQISVSKIAKLEKLWASEAERFEMVGGAGQTWTDKEKQAAASKGARQLTQDGPAPQTIYRVSTVNNSAFLVNVHLRYRR